MVKKYVYECKDGRTRLIIKDGNKRTTVSYPRILMEEKLGRPLEPYEEVNHIDGNPRNNNLDNLEVLTKVEHRVLHNTKYVSTIEKCMICGKEFIMTNLQWKTLMVDIHRSNKKHRIITCSKSCAGKASSGKYDYLYELEDRLKELYGEQEQ